MTTTRVIVVPDGAEFVLRTSAGNPIGQRMLSQDPAKGRSWPTLQDRFSERRAADRAALDWNVYLSGLKRK